MMSMAGAFGGEGEMQDQDVEGAMMEKCAR